MPSLDDLHRHNTRVVVPSLGKVELKYVSGSDCLEFEKIIFQNLANDEIAKKILHQQLLTPKLSYDAFISIPSDELLQITNAFIKNEGSCFEYYIDTGKLYDDFVNALKTDIEDRRQQFQSNISPSVISAQQALASFNLKYASILGEHSRALAALGESMNKAARVNIDPLIKIDLKLQPIIVEQARIARSITEALAPQIDIWKKWADTHQDIFSSTAKVLADFSTKYQVAQPEAINVLSKYKWFVSPSIPLTLIFEVQKLNSKPGRQDKAVNRLFIKYFEANDWLALENMAAGWSDSPYLASRYKIITDCVLAVKEGSKANLNMSNIVLPTLIVQIDGIVNDYMDDKGLPHSNGYTNRRNTLYSNPMPVTLPNPLNDLANEVFLNILFQTSYPGVPLETPFNFNRHKILHAENKTYGRKDYMIRAFMVLDLLASLR